MSHTIIIRLLLVSDIVPTEIKNTREGILIYMEKVYTKSLLSEFFLILSPILQCQEVFFVYF